MNKYPIIFLIFWVFLRLGLTSFGGPLAHIGYFHQEFVVRRKWLSENEFNELVALCQFLPGPASSQVGLAIGFAKGGYIGAMLAWIAFTLPSVVMLILFAVGMMKSSGMFFYYIVPGLKIVAVVIVAHALLGMFKSHCTDKNKVSLMVLSCVCALIFPYGQWLVIIICAGLGFFYYKIPEARFVTHLSQSNYHQSNHIAELTLSHGVFWLVLFLLLLFFACISAFISPGELVKSLSIFYRTGASVFGGGHVVLPFLEAQLVNTRLIENSIFISGYGAAQAVPGPLFTFAAFLGFFLQTSLSPYWVALLSLLAIFLPGILLVFSALPFWYRLRQKNKLQGALALVNVGVVGLLLATFYDALWGSAIIGYQDFIVAILLFLFICQYKFPSWVIVILGVLAQNLVLLISFA
ncbi:chromate efflux transporter [Thorsellia kenyensis]|uniref:Chromate efflux transporter n=1 Tax=Thorsellia kenyensis TaxID=1549888 RepID=A0ABV6CCR0_9GAMM